MPCMACSCLRMQSTFMANSLLSYPILPIKELFSAKRRCASRELKFLSSCVSFSCPCSLPTVSLKLTSSLSLSSGFTGQTGVGGLSALELWMRWLRWMSILSKGELLASLATRSLTLIVLEQMFLYSEPPVQGRFFSKLRILKKSFSSLLFMTSSKRSLSGYRLESFLQALWHLGLLEDFTSCSGPSFLMSFSKSFLMLESSAFMFWKKARLLPFSTVWRGVAFQSILQGTKSCSWLREARLEERVMAWGVHLSALDFFIKLILKFITHTHSYINYQPLYARKLRYNPISSFEGSPSTQSLMLPQKHQFQKQMEQSQSVSFESDAQRKLFDILTTRVHFQDRAYLQEDLQVDLVLRLPLPNQRYLPRRSQPPFNELFHNNPSHYAEAYETVWSYINFQVQTDPACVLQGSITKAMTSIKKLDHCGEKFKGVYTEEGSQESMVFQCWHAYFPDLDVFTLNYNMIMLVLQTLCGFRVKTFVVEQGKEECVYFLLSHSVENFMKLADRHKIMKEVNMKEIDFYLNDPVDSAQRPLRLHSYFRNHQELAIDAKQKSFARLLKTKNSMVKSQVIEEAELSKKQIKRYIEYCEEFQEYLRELSTIEIPVTARQKEYIFTHNRGKSNQGCYQRLREMKLRELVYQKAISLNKKYGYPIYEYSDCFFQFQLPAKHKPFFEKFTHLMTYKHFTIPPNGQLTLFNNMERAKLAYLSLQDFLKIENLYKIGLEAYALNNNFQRFGTSNFNFFSSMTDWMDFNFKKKRLIDQWHGFIPFLTNITAVRGYMGEKFAYELLVKIHLINFFTFLAPLSILAQFIGVIFFSNQQGIFTYGFTFINLVLVIISLRLFQATWKRKEDEFFANFVENFQTSTQEENYKGPYIRNIVTDQPNQYTLQLTLENRIIRFFTFLGLGILLLIEAFSFYGLRIAILKNYHWFPVLPSVYISLPHLVFYAVFFWSNYLVYRFVFSKIIAKLIQFQNFPTKQEQTVHLSGYVYMFTFGIQLLGPLFIYVIEPFQGKSCYSASCMLQFSAYIYSRYFIIFSFLLVKIIYVIGFYFTGSIIEIKDVLFDQNSKSEAYMSYQEKYSQLLQHVQKEYKKKDISFQIRQEALSLYYYCLYSIAFPFCSVLALGLLLLDYIVVRIDVLRNGRRPIPNSKSIVRLSGVYSNIVHICIIVNSWSFIYIQEVLEYNYTELIQYFVVNISKDNILGLKIIATAFLIGLLEAISGVVTSLTEGTGKSKLQKRKANKFKNFLIDNGKSDNREKSINLQQKYPIKSVFRTYPLQSIKDFKKSRFKDKNRAQLLKELNQKYYAPYIIRQTQFQRLQTQKDSASNQNQQEQIMEQTQSELIYKGGRRLS